MGWSKSSAPDKFFISPDSLFFMFPLFPYLTTLERSNVKLKQTWSAAYNINACLICTFWLLIAFSAQMLSFVKFSISVKMRFEVRFCEVVHLSIRSEICFSVWGFLRFSIHSILNYQELSAAKIAAFYMSTNVNKKFVCQNSINC